MLYLEFGSNVTPKNFVAVSFSVLLSAIFKSGNIKGRSFVTKKVYLVFLLFKDTTFTLNSQSLISFNSSLDSVYYYFCILFKNRVNILVG